MLKKGDCIKIAESEREYDHTTIACYVLCYFGFYKQNKKMTNKELISEMINTNVIVRVREKCNYASKLLKYTELLSKNEKRAEFLLE